MALTDEQFLSSFNRRQSPLALMFDMHVLEVSQERGLVRFSFEIGAKYCNPRGTVQGGILSTLMDEAAAHAGIIKLGERGFIATLEMKTSFFGPAQQGTLFVEARCLKMGRATCFLEADLTDAAGKLLARMTQTASPVRTDQKPLLVEKGSGS